jgi:hypothetical protein
MWLLCKITNKNVSLETTTCLNVYLSIKVYYKLVFMCERDLVMLLFLRVTVVWCAIQRWTIILDLVIILHLIVSLWRKSTKILEKSNRLHLRSWLWLLEIGSRRNYLQTVFLCCTWLDSPPLAACLLIVVLKNDTKWIISSNSL